jgi:DNA (cytosine-5)-methyltransferase 1
MRDATNGEYPKYAVWENVPGAFSSNCGKDFQAVLQTLCQVKDPNAIVPEPAKGKWQHAGAIVADGYSIAWRLYDAQFWGVAQRRKRVYLIVDFTTDRAPEILFEQESLRRNIETGTAEREDPANDAQGSIGRSSAECIAIDGYNASQSDKASTLGVNCGMSTGRNGVCYSVENHPNDSRVKIDQHGKVQTLNSRMGTGGNNVPLVLCAGNGQAHDTMTEMASTLNCMHDQPYIVKEEEQPDRKYIVRRLTPLECCRLQGFPDWWTDGVDGSDSAKYKMWGNGIALPCAVDVIGKIHKALERRR